MVRRSLAIALVAGTLAAGCTNPDGTSDTRMNSALLGTAGGAMIGQAVGGDSRSTLIGAAGGAAAGVGIDALQQRQACQTDPRLCR
jgi:hypothetical protein